MWPRSAWLAATHRGVLLIFILIFGAAYLLFVDRPTSFLPNEDQGVFFVNVQLPEAAALARTRTVMQEVSDRAAENRRRSERHRRQRFQSSQRGQRKCRPRCLRAQALGLNATTPDRGSTACLDRVRRELAADPAANIFAFSSARHPGPGPNRAGSISGCRPWETRRPRAFRRNPRPCCGRQPKSPALGRCSARIRPTCRSCFSTSTAPRPNP